MNFKLFFSIALLAGLFFAACKHESKNTLPAATADAKNVKYQCPMDCEKGKMYGQPGKCPVCHMDLKQKDVKLEDLNRAKDSTGVK